MAHHFSHSLVGTLSTPLKHIRQSTIPNKGKKKMRKTTSRYLLRISYSWYPCLTLDVSKRRAWDRWRANHRVAPGPPDHFQVVDLQALRLGEQLWDMEAEASPTRVKQLGWLN